MILPAQEIRFRSLPGQYSSKSELIKPFVERGVIRGRSYGLSSAGYDIRLGKISTQGGRELSFPMTLFPGEFILGVSVEKFSMHNDLLAICHDKSSWARQGISVFNTVLEPGWTGHLTLEISNRGVEPVVLEEEDPIAQIVFHKLLEASHQTYRGKYQNAEYYPQPVLFEKA